MKLTLQHLSGYLPYGLRIKNKNTEMPLTGYYLDELNDPQFGFDDTFKPILHPLSDLTKEIEVNGEKFVPKIKLDWNDGNNNSYDDILEWISVYDYLKLLEWHFDIHNLIENNLAIDKNTIL